MGSANLSGMEQHWGYHATRSRKAADTDSASVKVEWNPLLENSTQRRAAGLCWEMVCKRQGDGVTFVKYTKEAVGWPLVEAP